MKMFPNVINIHLYTNNNNNNKKFPKIYMSHESQNDFTCIIKYKNFSHNFYNFLGFKNSQTLICTKKLSLSLLWY